MKVNSHVSGLGQPAAKHGGGKVNVKSLSGPNPGVQANKGQPEGADRSDKAGRQASGSGVTAANAGCVTSSTTCKFCRGTEGGFRRFDIQKRVEFHAG